MNEPTKLFVRTGKGHYDSSIKKFSDACDFIARIPRQHEGWDSITYRNQRYQLFGGIRTPWNICLDMPIKKGMSR